MDFWDIVMAAATQGGGDYDPPDTPGNELWAQPAFDASTGVTLNSSSPGFSVPTISTGKLRCTLQDDGEEGIAEGRAFAAALETLVAGTYRVAFTIDSIGSGVSARVTVGGTGGTVRTTAATFSEDVVIAASVQTIQIAFNGSVNNQQIVVDNFSVKQLT